MIKRVMISFAAILTICLVSACARLTVPNIEVCRDKGALGAHCSFTNVDVTRDISRADWDNERFGQFCMNEKEFARNQLFFEQACELMKNCDVETLKKEFLEFLKRSKE